MNSSVIRRVRHLAAFFILPLLFSCSEGSPDFRMMSFNVRYINDAIDTGQTNWESRKGPVLKLLKDKMPDVIGFQEPRREQVDFIVAGLPMYGHIELGRDHGISEDGGEHLMIMYIKDKYDLTDSGFWVTAMLQDDGLKLFQIKLYGQNCKISKLLGYNDIKDILIWKISEEL